MDEPGGTSAEGMPSRESSQEFIAPLDDNSDDSSENMALPAYTKAKMKTSFLQFILFTLLNATHVLSIRDVMNNDESKAGEGSDVISVILILMNTQYFNQYVVQLIRDEVGLYKLLNFSKRNLMSSVVRKSRWKLKNLKNLTRIESEGNVRSEQSTFQLLTRPFLFTVAFSSASIAGTAIWQYENVRKKAITLMKKSWLTDKLGAYGKKKYNWRNEVNKLWNQLTEGEKLFAPICFINVVIFLAWRIPRLQPTMIKYFCSTPFGEAVCWPMILCTFSHYNVFHLATNMFVLHSFANSAVDVLGKEQFLGLYLAGGVISSFFSYMYKAAMTKQSLSMGASGAVMAILAYVCSKYPESKLSIIILPWVVFSAGIGLKCLMGLDLLGAIWGWKFFDHAAHLGGALIGIGWCYWGNTYIWQKREPLLHWWHEIRTASK